MKKFVLLVIPVLLLSLASCQEGIPTDWTAAQKVRIRSVLSGKEIPFYYLGKTYEINFMERPVDTFNAVAISCENYRDDLNVRRYIRTAEAANYVGIKSFDELVLFYSEDTSVFLTIGVFTKEVRNQVLSYLQGILDFPIPPGFPIEIPDIPTELIFPNNLIPEGSAFIYAVLLSPQIGGLN